MIEFRPVLYVIGYLLAMLGGAMLIPALFDFAADHPDWRVFLSSAAFTLFFAVALILANAQQAQPTLNLRQAFLLTTLSWVVLSGFAALPFLFANLKFRYADAFFEAVSGLTTTGATALVGLDGMPPGLLLWRAMLQGIGGIGIIVMAMAMLPALQVGGMQLFRSESSDRSEKALPRAAQVAGYISAAYGLLILACTLAYWAAGMSLFDALAHAMPTVATGGFSTYDASIAYFASPAVEWVGIVFMVSGSLVFAGYAQMLRGDRGALWRDEQVRWFFGMLAISVAVIALWRWLAEGLPMGLALRSSAFNTVSVVTTTGFASEDFNAWGTFPVVLLFMLFFSGGCTGSTTGSIKTFRYVILFGVLRRQFFRLTHPHGVYSFTFNGARVTPELESSVLAFFFLYFVTVFAVAVGLSLVGLDFITALSGAASAVGNVGPGFGDVIGPAGNFAAVPDAAKWLLSAAMLLGRLELFTVLVIFTRGFWRG